MARISLPRILVDLAHSATTSTRPSYIRRACLNSSISRTAQLPKLAHLTHSLLQLAHLSSVSRLYSRMNQIFKEDDCLLQYRLLRINKHIIFTEQLSTSSFFLF